MNKDIAKEIIYTVIAITLGILAVKFIIWLLPIILIALFSHYIYKSLKKHKKTTKERNNNKKNNKTIKIIDMVEED